MGAVLAEAARRARRHRQTIPAALPQPGDGSLFRVIDGRSESPAVEGMLRRKGLHDELRGDMYAVLEDPHGQAHYVRIDDATAERLTEGNIVRAAVQKESWAKPMDAVLEKVASESGGIYDPQRPLASLNSRPVVAGGQPVNALAPIVQFLNDDAAIEIMLNADGRIWVEKAGVGMLPRRSPCCPPTPSGCCAWPPPK